MGAFAAANSSKYYDVRVNTIALSYRGSQGLPEQTEESLMRGALKKFGKINLSLAGN